MGQGGQQLAAGNSSLEALTGHWRTMEAGLLENADDSVHPTAQRHSALNVRWQSVCRRVRKVGTNFCTSSLWQHGNRHW